MSCLAIKKRKFMERFEEYRQAARHRVKNADYLVTKTYPMVKDNKLLLAAAENLADALNLSVLSALSYERLSRKIPPFRKDPESALNSFKRDVVPRLKIDKNYIKLIEDLNSLVMLHKKSAVEFSRKDKYLIASDNYQLTELSESLMKQKLDKARRFIEEMEILVSK